jgi:hypothetical protein
MDNGTIFTLRTPSFNLVRSPVLNLVMVAADRGYILAGASPFSAIISVFAQVIPIPISLPGNEDQ